MSRMSRHTFRLPEDLFSQIHAEAKANALATPDFVRYILERGLRTQSIERQLRDLQELLRTVRITAGPLSESLSSENLAPTSASPPAIDPARFDMLEAIVQDALRAATRAWVAITCLVEMREGIDSMRHLREKTLKRADTVVANILDRHKTQSAIPKLEVP